MTITDVVRRSVTGPGAAARVAGTALLLWTVLGQHPHGRFDRIRQIDTFSLTPNWKFFAPNPAVHDSQLMYRTLNDEGVTSPWKDVGVLQGRKLRQLLWFPTRRPEKAVQDLATETLPVLDEGFGVVRNLPAYRLMVGYLRRRIHADGALGVQGFQFALTRTAGYDGSQPPELVFTSPYTPLRPEAEPGA